MTSLRELQHAFVDCVRFDGQAICSAIVANGVVPAKRLNIYRNNVREGFTNTLEATFPVVLRLSGADWFRQTASEYWRAYPSRSGNLHYVGELFADWLAQRLADTPYAYFADVARLEWAYQEVLVAADHPSFDVAALADVSADDYGSLRFNVHPAVRLVPSEYPILDIWKANQPGVASESTVRLDSGASRVLVIRRDDHVELRELARGDFALLQALARGETLAEAADAALRADAAIDLGASLMRITQWGTLVDFCYSNIAGSPPLSSDHPPSAIR